MPEPLLHILLIDDDEDDATLVRSNLREVPGSPYQFEWVSDYETGISKLQHERFDAALVDYRLGARDGVQLIQEALSRGILVPLILLTGQDERELDVDALGAGAADFISKGELTPGLLERSIRYAVQRRKSEHDRLRLVQEQAARERAEAAAEAVREHALRLEFEIAERKRVEQALRQSDESFRQLADAMPQIVWSSTPDGRPDYFNKRWYEYTGMAAEDSFDKDGRWKVVHPDDVENMRDAWKQAIESNSTYQCEFRLCHKESGRYRWQLARAIAVRDEEGTITRWFGTSTDIDDHKRAEEAVAEHARKLAASNAELESFAYVASHDLKEPLRGISAYAEMLLEDLGPVAGPEEREKLQTLVRLCKRMYDLLDSLLELSRVGRVGGTMDEAPLGDLVSGVLDQLSARIQEENATIVVGELPTMVCDRLRVTQVFTNLIANALKYNEKPEKRVEIGCTTGSDSVPVLHVRDNGIGIASRHHETVFRVFRRLHGRDAYGGGTGVGLAIVKRIIQQHGGRIWLESIPGEGTTFYFTLAPGRDSAEFQPHGDLRRDPAGREAGLIEPRRTSTVPSE